MRKYVKVVIVPCLLDKKGMVVAPDVRARPPYGYHHILGVYRDGSYWTIGTIDRQIPIERVKELVAVFIDPKITVEIDQDFYKKFLEANS